MIKCGCVTEYDRSDHRWMPDATDCLLPEAVELIRELSVSADGWEPEIFDKAKAFLKKCEGE